ncbi:hypothetical protein GA0070621_0236 [Micromonospora narathiwatensis]|uniref:Uncharacterized protein n=1 Tax=Micromonospora narathiwatensis TaxID=299146 RepID=A0A1A8Z1R6_9ACTN|nr:hypothetical protein GA0070621_0236 [Micromonospora narathiwatensis]
MDLLAWPGPRLAGWVAKVLDVEGRTPEARRAEVIRDMTSAPGDDYELFLRHLTRSVTWFVLLALVFPATLLLLVPASFLPGGRDGTPFLAILFAASLLTFFALFMACVHLLKALVVNYLLEDRWDGRSRVGRALMLAQTPDVVVALGLAVLVARSLV